MQINILLISRWVRWESKEKKVKLTALFPKSTHISIPCEVAFFKPMKSAYRKTYDKEVTGNNFINFDRSVFLAVLNKELEKNNFSEAIINGFKTTGLCQFNENKI